MTRVFAVVLFGLALGVCANTARAQKSYQLLSGDVLTGEPIHFNAQGVVVKRTDGTFAPRTAWTNFSEAGLKELGKDARAKPFVDQFLEAEEEEQADRRPEAAITVKPPPRLQRANLKAGFGAIFTSPLSVTLLVLFWAANIYAAFEVALFRNYPWLLVCGIAAVVPVIGPVLFLCLPTYAPGPTAEEIAAEAAYAAEAPPTEIPLGTAEPAPGAPAHAGHAPAAPAAAAGPAHTVYKRGQFTFNRRFFETKLANFLRVTPSEADKDLVLFIKSSRGEYTAQRVSRITPNEVVLLLVKGAASQDVTIPFTEISEVHVKHKDA
jgi:hypothetical protein